MSGQDIDELFRLSRETQAAIVRIGANQDGMSALLSEVRADLKAISVHGCAVGERHSADLAELKGKPERTMAAVGALVGIGTALVGVVIYIAANTP